MQKEVSFLRQAGWVSPERLPDRLYVIGCGAIGSNVALMAAKMGWSKFALWDMDIVENHNLPNQTYGRQDVGTPKVEALKRVLQEFNPDIDIEIHNEAFTSDQRSQIAGPVVIATDSMSSRADITKAFSYNHKVPYVLEARLGFDYGEVHILNPLLDDELELWKQTLKSDDEIPEGPCNLRICATLVGVVSSTLVHYLCVPYAERRGRGEWEYPHLTRFVLQDSLIVRIHV